MHASHLQKMMSCEIWISKSKHKAGFINLKVVSDRICNITPIILKRLSYTVYPDWQLFIQVATVLNKI